MCIDIIYRNIMISSEKSDSDYSDKNDQNISRKDNSHPKMKVLKINWVLSRGYNDDICSICHNPLTYACVSCQKKGNANCDLASGVCKHIFHADCIHSWLKTQKNISCPVDQIPFNYKHRKLDNPDALNSMCRKKK